jgi:viroplasmin and RNaseH domain-containing protein
MIEIRATFESKEEAIQWLQGSDAAPVESKQIKAKTEQPVEDDEPVETKKPKAKKAKKQDPAKVKKDLLKAIRDFIMEDKVANTRKVLPLMPDGQKDIKALSMEQAQEICRELGIDV